MTYNRLATHSHDTAVLDCVGGSVAYNAVAENGAVVLQVMHRNAGRNRDSMSVRCLVAMFDVEVAEAIGKSLIRAAKEAAQQITEAAT